MQSLFEPRSLTGRLLRLRLFIGIPPGRPSRTRSEMAQWTAGEHCSAARCERQASGALRYISASTSAVSSNPDVPASDAARRPAADGLLSSGGLLRSSGLLMMFLYLYFKIN
jgi:hypothetical protein